MRVALSLYLLMGLITIGMLLTFVEFFKLTLINKTLFIIMSLSIILLWPIIMYILIAKNSTSETWENIKTKLKEMIK
jgi:hypothetical protein